MPRGKYAKWLYEKYRGAYEALNPNRVKEEKAQEELKESRDKEQEYIDQRQAKQDAADKAIEELLNNFPELADNKPFIDQLQKGLEASGKTLSDVYQNIKTAGGTYLDQLAKSVGASKQELKRSETTAQEGINKGLDIYKNLAKQRKLPGQQAIEDQLSETTANALSTIKKSGGGQGLSALTNIYKQEMENRRNLGIQAANFQTQNQQNLAGAEMGAGTTMADIIARNAINSSNLSSTLYGAQSDYLNKLSTSQTNIAQQQANTAQTMYGVNTENQMNQYLYNQLAPTQAKLGWEQTKYQMNDPFAAQLQKFTSDQSFAYMDMMTAIQQRNENNKKLMQLGGDALKLIDPTKISSFLNFNSNSNGKIIPYDYTPNNNQDIFPT